MKSKKILLSIIILLNAAFLSLTCLTEKYAKSPISSRKYAILFNGYKIGEETISNFSGYFRFKKVIKTKREIITSIRKKEEISKIHESYLFIESLTGKPIFFRSKRVLGYQDEIETSGMVKEGFILLKKDNNSSKKIETKELFLFPSYVETQIKKNGLKVGSEYNFKVFDPSLETIIDLLIDVKSLDDMVINGKIYKLFNAEGTYYYPNMTIKFRAWFNKNGIAYKVIYPSMKMEKILVELLNETQISEISDFSYNVPVSENIPYNPRFIEELEIKIENENIAELKEELESSSSIQRIIKAEDNFVILSIKSREHLQDNLLPCSISELNKKEERYLKPTAYTQSDDREIKSLANKIAKDEKNLFRILREINTFVFEHLSLNPKKNMRIGLARPKEILSLKSGDCTEHAILFASLARALGIPTRVVGGVVYDSQYFAYHMWAQVWCKEWIDVDPAFQQIGVDATHIAFASSDLSEKSLTEMNLILTHFITQTNYHILKVGVKNNHVISD